MVVWLRLKFLESLFRHFFVFISPKTCILLSASNRIRTKNIATERHFQIDHRLSPVVFFFPFQSEVNKHRLRHDGFHHMMILKHVFVLTELGLSSQNISNTYQFAPN